MIGNSGCSSSSGSSSSSRSPGASRSNSGGGRFSVVRLGRLRVQSRPVRSCCVGVLSRLLSISVFAVVVNASSSRSSSNMFAILISRIPVSDSV